MGQQLLGEIATTNLLLLLLIYVFSDLFLHRFLNRRLGQIPKVSQKISDDR